MLCIYMYVCACMCLYVCIYMCVRVRVRMCVCVHIQIDIDIDITIYRKDVLLPRESPTIFLLACTFLFRWFEDPLPGFEWFTPGCLDENRLAYIGLRDIDAEEVFYSVNNHYYKYECLPYARLKERRLGTFIIIIIIILLTRTGSPTLVFGTSTRRR